MDDLEQLVAEIEGTEEPKQRETNPVKQLRDTLKARDKERKELLSELEELRAFRQEQTHKESVAKAAEVFDAVGLSTKQADLFIKLNPEAEVTPETVREFADSYGLPITEKANSAPFKPAEGGVPADGTMSRDELNALYRENPGAALKALQEGRVRWNNTDTN